MASVNKREWTSPKGERKSAWEVRYKEGGRHRSKAFRLLKDAQVYARRVENELEAGLHIAASEAKTIAQVSEMYFAHCEQRRNDKAISLSRLIDIEGAIRRHINPSIGHIQINNVAWTDLDAFFNELRERRTGYSTLRKVSSVLKLIEEFAHRRGFCKQMIVGQAARENLRGVPRPRVETFSHDEIRDLLTALEAEKECGPGTTKRLRLMRRCIVNLALFCGLRFGEIMALVWERVDLDGRVIEVRRSMTRFRELKSPKTEAGNRNVPIPDHLIDLLRCWKNEHSRGNKHSFLFSSSTGRPISSPAWHRNYWRPLLKDAGLSREGKEEFHFHALRHFAASYFIETGMPLPRVAAVLGHATFNMTLQTYAHDLRRDDLHHDVVDTMASRLMNATSVTHEVRTTR